MTSSKGLGLPRRMLLMFVFTSLILVQHAQAAGDLVSDCDTGVPVGDPKHPDVACKTAIDTGLTCPVTGKCVCPPAKPLFDNTKKTCGGGAGEGSPTTTARSGGTGSVESSAVRTFIPSIFALVGLFFLGIAVLSTF